VTDELDRPIPYRVTPVAIPPGQRLMLAAIRDFWLEQQRSPTIRELQEALDIRSPNGVVAHLKPLAAKGLIELAAGTSRGIWPAGLRERIRQAVDAMNPTEEPCTLQN
jgi:SOS-response transcriptional repressor LexA